MLGDIEVSIERFCSSPHTGTFGRLTILKEVESYFTENETIWEEIFECFTCESSWANNTPGVSCIPAGNYTCRPRKYYRGGYDSVEVVVPKRKFILFHKGNTPLDTRGCILLGGELGMIHGRWAIENSKGAFNKFMDFVVNREFTLNVKNPHVLELHNG